MIKNQKILITGGLGFIGFNTADYFSTNNKVCVIDNCSRSGTEYNIDKLKELNVGFHNLDVSRFKELREVFYSFQPDIVIHQAAQVAVTLSINNPVQDFNSNVLGSFNILELVRTFSKKTIILYASTNKVYGDNFQKSVLKSDRYAVDNEFGIAEDEKLSFQTPYGCSKGAADQYFIDYARTYNIPTVVFRQSCIYGPHQYGIEDQGWVAWFAICSIFSKPITIFGDGRQVRDILYVDDLIQAYEKAFINIDLVKGEVFNIGGGPSNSVSIHEVLSILKEKAGKSMDISYSDWRKSDQKVYVSDVRKAERLLDWSPIICPNDGISKMLDWIQTEGEHMLSVLNMHHDNKKRYDVSIIIPARNEEECLALVLDELELNMQSSMYRYEVIVVDDHSTDRTSDIAKQYSFVKLIKNKYKPGKGGTLRSGFDVSEGNYIAMMDADFSHDSFDLERMVDEVIRKNGLVVASRITGGSEEYTRVRAFGNVFLTWFFGFLHGRYLSDVLNGFKIFHRDVYFNFEYNSSGFEIEIELLVNTLRLKREINEYPSRERKRFGGKMKSSVIMHGPRFFWKIFLEYFKKPRMNNS